MVGGLYHFGWLASRDTVVSARRSRHHRRLLRSEQLGRLRRCFIRSRHRNAGRRRTGRLNGSSWLWASSARGKAVLDHARNGERTRRKCTRPPIPMRLLSRIRPHLKPNRPTRRYRQPRWRVEHSGRFPFSIVTGEVSELHRWARQR